jgi:hypothetical protein
MQRGPSLPIILLDNGMGIGLDESLEDGGDGTAAGAGVVEGCEAVVAFVGCVVGLGGGEGLDFSPVGDSGLVVDDGGCRVFYVIVVCVIVVCVIVCMSVTVCML